MSLLGQRLRQEREARGLPFLQIELDTRIRATIIQSLEEGDLENLPPEPFLRGLIRSYATYLRVNPQELLDLYEADTTPAPPPPSSFRQRPVAAPHSGAVRPDNLDDQKQTAPAEMTPPRPWVRLPEEKPPVAPSMASAASTPSPINEQPPAKPASIEPPREPASVPEPVMPTPQNPLSRLRRRLPLAPPSPKPKNPFLPSGRDKPPAIPPPPPETLPPPERLEQSIPKPERPASKPEPPAPNVLPPAPKVQPSVPEPEPPKITREPEPAAEATPPELAPIARSRSGWPINLKTVPRSSVILMSIAIVSGLLACGLFAFTRLAPMALSIAANPTATPTRLPPTPAPTSVPGSVPTSIPTIAATAPPFTPITVVVVPTPKATPKSTLAAGSTELNLDIDATQPVTAQIGIDGVTVFNGPIAAGQSLSWSAKETLYMRVENAIGASIRFNTKRLGALNFGERALMERQWTMKDGKPTSVAPVPPPTPKPASGQPIKSVPATATPAATASPPTPTLPAATSSPTMPPSPTKPPSPSPTLTPFS